MRDAGFIYVLSNEAMPGLVKVGRTARLAEDRARELTTTGVPLGFEVEYRLRTSFCEAAECRAHELLAHCRLASNREFFRANVDEAISAVNQAALDAAGLARWSLERVHYLRGRDVLVLNAAAGQIYVLLEYRDFQSALSGGPASIVDVWGAHFDGDQLEFYAIEESEYVASFSAADEISVTDPLPYLDRAGEARNPAMNGRERLVPGQRLLWMDPNSPECESTVFEAITYVQVVSRTRGDLWSFDAPRLLNFPELPHPLNARAVARVQAALSLGVPRTWAPSMRERGSEWTTMGVSHADPEVWLPQLQRTRKDRPHGAR